MVSRAVLPSRGSGLRTCRGEIAGAGSFYASARLARGDGGGAALGTEETTKTASETPVVDPEPLLRT